MFNRSNNRQAPGDGSPSEAAARTPLQAVNWLRLLGYLKPYRGRMLLAIAALAAVHRVGPGLPGDHRATAGHGDDTHQAGPLNLLAGLLIGIFLLQAAFSFLQSYLLAYIGERIVLDLRTSLYAHLQELSLDFYAVRRVGDLVSRLSSDVTQMRTVLTTTITSLLSQIADPGRARSSSC